MTYSACNTKTIKVLSNIFSVDFREHCATIATTKRQKFRKIGKTTIYSIEKGTVHTCWGSTQSHLAGRKHVGLNLFIAIKEF